MAKKLTDNISKQVQEYKIEVIKKAERLVNEGFPEKIIQLNELLASPMFSERNFDQVHQDLNISVPDPVLEDYNAIGDVDGEGDQPPPKRQRIDYFVPGTKVMILPTGTVKCNESLCEVIRVVKPIISKLVEDSNLMKMWIAFMIPKIEDGNNFGVLIQQGLLSMIKSIQSQGVKFFSQITHYFVSRAKVVSKVAKYPHIEDYRRAVAELDEKQFMNLWQMVCEMRNRYCSLHDIVIKNIEKLKTPRSSNAESLY